MLWGGTPHARSTAHRIFAQRHRGGGASARRARRRAHGKKALAHAFAPAIALARDGFPLIEYGVSVINEVAAELRPRADLYGEWARLYADGSGKVAFGNVLRQPALARTLEALAKE